MIRRILVPLDGSAVAETILPCVRHYARLAGASVTLLHVAAPRDERPPGASSPLHTSWSAAQAYLAEVATDFRVDDIPAETRVMAGLPAEEIIAAGRTFDLIATATHGRGGFGRLVHGSVAEAVVRGATTPVLLARARPDGHVTATYPRRVLVPLDGADLAEHALPLAITIARLADAELILTESVAWVGEIAVASPYTGAIAGAKLLQASVETASDYLRRLSDRLNRQGLRARVDVRYDQAASGILNSAAEQQADLIVMSTHARSGLDRLVFGSVSADVLHAATMPILLVRGDVPVRVHAVRPAPVVAAPAD